MLTLSNGATVHAAYIVPASWGIKPHGICLANNGRGDWVVWNIYWDGVLSNPNIGDGSHEVWEAENGDYFLNNDEGRLGAELNFGRRLFRMMTDQMFQGFREAADI
jgi:hypothetical protein